MLTAKKYFPQIVALGAVVVIIGLASLRAWSDSSPVRIGHLPIAAHLPVFVAAEKDLFEKHSVDVELLPYPSSTDLLNALRAGDIDVAYEMSADLVLLSQSQERDFLRVYQMGVSTSKSPIDAIVVSGDSPVQSIAELRGTTIGVFPGPTASAMARLILERNGLSMPNDAKITAVLPNLQLGSLINGQVGALFTYEPIPTLAVSSGQARILHRGPVEDILGLDPWIGGFGAMSTTFMRQSPKKAAAVRDAVYDAFDYVAAHPEESRAMLRRYVRALRDIDISTLRAIPLTDHWKRSQMDRDTLTQLIDFYKANGVLPTDLEIDQTRLIAEPRDFGEDYER